MGLLDFFGGKDQSDETTTLNDVSGFRTLQAPTARDLFVQLQQAVYQGDITPDQADQILQQQSELNGLDFDEKLQEDQYKALAQLKSLAGSEGGFTPQTRAALDKIYDNFASTTRSANASIEDRAAQQGQSTGALKFILQQQAEQDAAQNQNRFYTNAAADQENQRIQAIKDSAALAGGLSQQDLARRQQIAEANDRINQFNTNNRIDNQKFNISNNLQAQQANVANRQAIENKNVDIRNQQTQQNRDAIQAGYQNEFERQKAIAAGNTTTKRKSPGDKGAAVGNLLGTVGTLALAFSDEKLKENIDPADDDLIDKLLAKVRPVSYNYKKEMGNQDSQVGVLAQDLEKTPAKGAVLNTPMGKMVNGAQLSTVNMAVLANLGERLRKLEKSKK